MKIESYTEQICEFGGPDPGQPAPGIMQVFCQDGIPMMVDFLCPCGCGRTCPTHLVTPGHVKKPNDRHWNYAKGPTLTPSIRWTGSCKAHFHITDGKAIMCPDSGK